MRLRDIFLRGGRSIMEKVYINTRTGELYLLTNKLKNNSKPSSEWFFISMINDRLIYRDELEYLGEL
jgi:hypothetical protein